MPEGLEIDEDKLADYLGWTTSMDYLLELWEKLGGIYSPDEIGVADFLVREYGPEKICRILSAELELIPKLVSKDADLRKEAIELMEKMGFSLGRVENSDGSRETSC